MRVPIYDSVIRVRLDEALAEAAAAKAAREGRTLSELVRNAMRREVREAA